LVSQLKAKIMSAFQFAEDSPFPDPSEAFNGVFSNG
jgi:TPP-dependent pyruvate/acetoin dehydrogenase alpha subunit